MTQTNELVDFNKTFHHTEMLFMKEEGIESKGYIWTSEGF